MNKNTLFFYLWNYGVTWIPSRLGELIRQKVLKMFCRECGVNVNVAPHTLIKGANSMIIGDKNQTSKMSLSDLYRKTLLDWQH